MKTIKRVLLTIFWASTFVKTCLNIKEENDLKIVNSLAIDKSMEYYGKQMETSFKFKPPELEMNFLYLSIYGSSIGTQLTPEFGNYSELLGGILLHAAVQECNLNLMENLIDIKSDLNIEDRDGLTPLYKTLKMQNKDMVEMLVDAGANIDYISSKGVSLLEQSVVSDDYQVLLNLLNLGVKVDAINKDGVTALFKAAEVSNQNMIDALINKNANVNLKNSLGQSLLTIAVGKGKLDVVKQLIISGAAIDVYDQNGETPLITAVRQNNPGIIKILLENGANSSFISPEGNSFLHQVISEGRTDLIKKLLDLGANTTALNAESLTPLCYAIKINSINTIKILINNVDINYRCHGSKREFPLHFAISNGSVETIISLLEGGAKTNIINDNGLTPLAIAVFENKENIIQLLKNISHGLTYKIDRKGNTPLHLAVSRGDIRATEKLLELGANVNSINEEGLTPLCKAAQSNKKEIIIILQTNGATLNFQTIFGDTPLHLAVSSKNITAVITLIKLGAEIDLINNQGLTPLCKAIIMNVKNIINAILVSGADVNAFCNEQSPYTLAVRNSTLSTVVRLTNLGATVNESNISLARRAVKADNPEIMNYLLKKSKHVSQGDYYELVFLAASSGSDKVVRELVKSGISVNIASSNGFSPLWYATMNNQISTMEILIECGGDLNKTVQYNKDGLDFSSWTLLHEAAFNGNIEALEILIKNGVNIESTDNRRWTPLHYAAAHHNVGVVKKLIKNGANIRAKTNRGEEPIDLLKHRRTYKPTMIEWLTTGKL